jgi:hypothetical protein
MRIFWLGLGTKVALGLASQIFAVGFGRWTAGCFIGSSRLKND